MTGYELSRQWWTFAADNKGKVKATHSAAFYYIVEIWNLLGKPENFGLPKMQAADVIGLNIKTFSNAFNDLVAWGFIKIEIESPNQFVATTISINAVVKFTNAPTKAHTNAILTQQPMHYVGTYQSTNQSTGDSTGDIIEPLTINQEPLTIKDYKGEEISPEPTPEEKLNTDSETPPLTTSEEEKKVAAKKRTVAPPFKPPPFDDILTHFQLLAANKWDPGRVNFEAKKFQDFYESKGWMVGKNKMQNWKAAISGWINRNNDITGTDNQNNYNPKKPSPNGKQTDYYEQAKRNAANNIFGNGQ